MKTFFTVHTLILVFALGVPAPEKQKTTKSRPDLTGTWMLDPSRSNVGPSRRTDRPLKITHHDPEFKITRMIEHNSLVTGQDLVYYTDGRGETNPTTMFLSTSTDMNPQGHDKDVTKSKTSWSGNKLVTRSSLRSIIAGRVLEFTIIDEWKLSQDGKTLTQTSRTVFNPDASPGVFIPANRPDIRRVYNRVPD
jgi:hypothetical protein